MGTNDKEFSACGVHYVFQGFRFVFFARLIPPKRCHTFAGSIKDFIILRNDPQFPLYFTELLHFYYVQFTRLNRTPVIVLPWRQVRDFHLAAGQKGGVGKLTSGLVIR